MKIILLSIIVLVPFGIQEFLVYSTISTDLIPLQLMFTKPGPPKPLPRRAMGLLRRFGRFQYFLLESFWSRAKPIDNSARSREDTFQCAKQKSEKLWEREGAHD